MSGLPVEAAVATTPTTNDQAVKTEGGDAPAPAPTPTTDDQAVKTEGGDALAPAPAPATVITDTKASDVASKETIAKSEAKEKVDLKSENNGEDARAKHEKGEKPRWSSQDRHNRKPQYQKRENCSKYDATVLEKSDDPAIIQNQVEFYFGDSNLPNDEHMMGLTGGPENKPVPVAQIYKFKRMMRFSSIEVITEALRASLYLDVVGEGKDAAVKRKIAYDPTTSKKAQFVRTVYVKGFGEEEPSSQFDIEAFFAIYGTTRAVRLRRNNDDNSFKGSVWVEFQDEKTATDFLALDPKPTWKGDEELLIKSKKDYCDEKSEDIRQGRLDPKPTFYPRRGGRGNDKFRGGRGNNRDRGGDRDPDDWKKRRDDDRASGFKNDRKGGRGGRGRGRGDRRGRGGDRRNDRDDRNRGHDDEKVDKVKAESKAEEPTINEKKRAREDDGPSEEPLAKKVDTKTEVPAAS